MKHPVLTALLFLLTVPAFAGDRIPSHLVGVWATETSVLRGTLLFEGAAVYLGAEGIGCIMGGPPPIGVRIVATFNPETNGIEWQETVDGKIVAKGRLMYDAAQKTLRSDEQPGQILRRRFNKLTNSTRKALGIELTTETEDPINETS